MKMKNATAACCVVAARELKAAKEHVEAFKALAHSGRLKVFFYIVKKNEPVPANEIQKALKLPAPTLSHHLEDLERAGLIRRTRKVRNIFSIVRREMVLELVRILTACC